MIGIFLVLNNISQTEENKLRAVKDINPKLLLFLLAIGLPALFQGCKDPTYAPRKKAIVKVIPPDETTLLSRNFNSNMVIQRDKPCLLWGNAAPGDTVNVQVSWSANAFAVITNSSGVWQVQVPATAATTTPQTILCSTRDSIPIKLSNILIGDVWICSGQSNMVKTMQIVTNSSTEIAAANYPDVRVATLPTNYKTGIADMLPARTNWSVCSAGTAAGFSAVAYYFARKLSTTMQVPIGVIVSAVGETKCDQWTSNAALINNTLLSSYYQDQFNSQLYNGMIYPLKNLAIKGFIWYQGEADRYDRPVNNYTLINSTMIGDWRALFNQGTLPFYFVQVTPYDIDYSATTDSGEPMTDDDYAKFREAQANVRTVTGTGMAVTMDVGDSTDLHPPNKEPVGERLALLALNNTYGQSVACIGPQYSSYTISNNTVIINYVPGTADGLTTSDGSRLAQYFFVAGADHVFRQGNAVISGSQVIITVPATTPLPVQAVRYAFTNYPITNLQNSAGLPAEPFRTDNWTN